jgi:hypothetical protein
MDLELLIGKEEDILLQKNDNRLIESAFKKFQELKI